MIVAALALPILALPLAWRVPTAAGARRLIGWLAVAIGALWVVALVIDPGATVGRFGVAPAAAGTWLLAASATWPARRLVAALSVVAAGVAAGGLSLAAGTGDLSDAAGALAIAAAMVVVVARLEGDRGVAPAALAALGAAAVAVGLVRLEADTGAFVAGGGLLVLAGAAAVVLAAGDRARRAGIVLLPLALVLGGQAGTRPRDAVVLGVVAVLVADRPAASLGLWSLAAATVSPPAGLLLGAAAVVHGAWRHRLAVLTALPGVAAFAYAGARDGSVAVAVLGALAAISAARLWRAGDDDVVGGRPTAPTIAALAVGAWLVLAPETWGWAVERASDAGLDHWGTGVAVAAVAAAVGAFVSASFSDAPFVLPDLEVADPPYGVGDPGWALPVAVASVVILAIAGAALVASVTS